MAESLRFAVIGCGLMGAAAARHLAGFGHRVSLIGAEEPENKQSHTGPFASHYDEGRISRVLDRDPIWAKLSAASIMRYGDIAEQSGNQFFHPVGAIMAAPEGDWINDVRAVNDQLEVGALELDRAALADRFAYFAFPDDTVALFETGTGHISPRRLVAAQSRIVMRRGGLRFPEPATAMTETAQECRIRLASGDEISADQVIIATGGYTGVNELAPVDIELSVLARTVVFFEVSKAEANRLSNMPSLVWHFDGPGRPYLLPPIQYPDGKYYIKLGGDPMEAPLADADAVSDWFRTDGDLQAAEFLDYLLRKLMPDLEIIGTHSQACVTSWTRSGYPIIERVSDRVTVVTGGNGAGAKCSDEIGRLGALVAVGETDRTYPAVFYR